MNIRILTVGSKPRTEIAIIIQDYLKRLPANIRVDFTYIKHARGDPTTSVQRESENILSKIPDSSYVVLLDETGKQLTSVKLSENMFSNNKDVTLIIGGAYGVSNELKQRADYVWSLGELVYPHQLVRVILAEQIYRAYTISIGHPYHHS